MRKIIAIATAFATSGCGAMFGSGTARVNGPPTARIDGSPLPATVSTKTPHQIEFEDGHRCVVESHASGGFVALDIVLLVALVVPGVIALAVDGSTGDWDRLEGAGCPEIIVD